MNRILKTLKVFWICAAAIFSIAAFGQQAPGSTSVPAMPAAVVPPAGIPAMGTPASQPAARQPETVSYENIFPEISPDKGKIGIGFFEKYWGWIAALCAAVLAGLYLIFRPRKPVPKTPYELAVAAIDAAEQNSADLDEKEYASQISFAVRAYIEGQHSIPAPVKTTQEFLKIAAKSIVFDKQQRALISQILNMSDMAKFARDKFTSAERAELSSCARKFLESDKIRCDIKSGLEKSATAEPEEAAETDGENGTEKTNDTEK